MRAIVITLLISLLLILFSYFLPESWFQSHAFYKWAEASPACVALIIIFILKAITSSAVGLYVPGYAYEPIDIRISLILILLLGLMDLAMFKSFDFMPVVYICYGIFF